ncbi:TRAF3IP1 [Lepeophtheirus salmonis]|uniref:TRAF3-interacting protein 1 n=1 Tax=Lepeophtheirus salmonis TaxID=72036 RepID=A0A7R8HDQ8_LEPSM|nr:TRAF3IP1 [Lepeophtheirus salmonis]CAF3030414.1 TRAF3IP1 [Lepeophtheirus salmonis]
MSVPGSTIKKTQDALGRYVKKPQLTDKLLNKPPFRFLHDVISVVIRDHGKFRGLFNESEMNSNNVKDKESKLKYLDKIIRAVSFATGSVLSAKPGKIVSGQEPVKTNEFLQALAAVIIVDLLLSSMTLKKILLQVVEPPSLTKKSLSSAFQRDAEPSVNEEMPIQKNEEPPESLEVAEEPIPIEVPQEEESKQVEPESITTPESVSRPITNRIKSAMRPPSSRPAAPRLRERPNIEPEEIIRPGTSTKPVNLILAMDDDEEEEDGDNFLIQETNDNVLHLEDRVDLAIDSHDVVEAEGKEHGGLVQEILATQKELNVAEEKQKVSIEAESDLTDLTYRRERESTQREIDKLKERMWTQCKRELDTWRNERKQLKAKLNQEEHLTQKSIQPLRDHLIEIEYNVVEQLDKISSVKGKILKNDEKIAKMLSSISNK